MAECYTTSIMHGARSIAIVIAALGAGCASGGARTTEDSGLPVSDGPVQSDGSDAADGACGCGLRNIRGWPTTAECFFSPDPVPSEVGLGADICSGKRNVGLYDLVETYAYPGCNRRVVVVTGFYRIIRLYFDTSTHQLLLATYSADTTSDCTWRADPKGTEPVIPPSCARASCVVDCYRGYGDAPHECPLPDAGVPSDGADASDG